MTKGILKKFDYDKTLIKEYKHWCLLLRPAQVTIGSLVLIDKSFSHKYSELPIESFSEFASIVKEIEPVLFELFKCDKINYLMLMMVDPEVHYHIIPRYSRMVYFENNKFEDAGWPGAPALSKANVMNDHVYDRLIRLLKYKIASENV